MSDSVAQEVRRLAIGRKIRALREREEMSLAELADRCEMPEVLLAQIEGDVVPPTVAALVRISGALKTTVDTFFRDPGYQARVEVVRSGEGRKMQRVRPSAGPALAYNYESLAYRMPGKHMEPFMVEFSLDVAADPAPVTHEGEEFLYVLTGEVEFLSASERIVLRPGDSIYFDSSVPHALRGLGVTVPKALAVLYPFS
ncbi:MAG: cupin domain-containing protein [Candidatus Schekmanbacteria bacterium]|nr:cupin domain-containing protein [Candidatus Schekmanbacteria bacterium]